MTTLIATAHLKGPHIDFAGLSPLIALLGGAVIAFSGVVMASVYALRLFIRAMHNRVGAGVQSREISIRDGAVLVPLVLVILFLALYPQLALHSSEASVKLAVAPAYNLSSPPRSLTGQEVDLDTVFNTTK